MAKELTAGQRISQYEVISTLGEGGMSRVYLCEDLVLHRRVALKQLMGDSSDSRSIIRMQQEGQSLARLSHPNIVQILTTLNTDDGVPYLVMELLHGCSLSQMLKMSGSLNVGEVLNLAGQVCDALQHAHDEGIVHRDIKPSNLFLCNQKAETVKIIDFGIAKIVDNSVNATRTGEFVGSPAYLSPEQALQKTVTAKSDQYSLACVLYECLSGRAPFEDESAVGLIMKHVNEPAPALSKKTFVPPMVAKAIDRALSKNSDARFESMAEFKDALFGKTLLHPGKNDKRLVVGAIAGALVFLAISSFMTYAYLTEHNKVAQMLDQIPTNRGNNGEITKEPLSLNSFPAFEGASLTRMGSEEYIKQLAQSDPYMSKLNLTGYGLTPLSLEIISKLTNLQTLEVPETDLSDSGGEAISHLHKLKLLDAARTRVGDAFLQKISNLPALNDVSFSETKITSKGLASLAKMPSLQKLSMRSCEELDKDAADILARMPNLVVLDLSKSFVDNDFVQKLCDLPNLKCLSINETQVNKDILPSIARMKSIQQVYFDSDGPIKDITPLLSKPFLAISLRRCQVTSHVVEQLAKIKSLQRLRLDDNPITDADLKRLAVLPNLMNLEITNCMLVTESGVSGFKKIKKHCRVKISDQERAQMYGKTEALFRDVNEHEPELQSLGRRRH